jgi:hypothetical protein
MMISTISLALMVMEEFSFHSLPYEHSIVRQPMKKILTFAWNLILITFVALAASVIIPKALGQFQGLAKLSEGSLRARTMMFGFQGIGLLVVIGAGALSLSSIFWRRVSWVWRGLFVGILAASCIGTLIAIRIDRADMGFVTYGDYFTFVLGTVVIALPIIACGTGYPNLLLRIYQRIRGNKDQGEQAAP